MKIFFASHTLHLLLCLPTDGVAGIYLFYLLNTLEHHFNVSGFNLFLTPIPERDKKPFEQTRLRESKPGLLRGKQVRYPLHHCLSGQRKRDGFVLVYIQLKSEWHCVRPRQPFTVIQYLSQSQVVEAGTKKSSFKLISLFLHSQRRHLLLGLSLIQQPNL